MSRFLIAFLLIAGATIAVAQKAVSDYDRLSVMTSEDLMDHGREFFANGDAVGALPYFLIVSERYKDDDNATARQLSIRALNNIGLIYKYFIYDYPQAYDYLNRAYELSVEYGEDDLTPMVMVNLGDLFNDYGVIYNSDIMKEKSEALFDQSFKKSYESKDWRMLATSFFNLSCLNYEIDLKKYGSIFADEIPKDAPNIEFVRLQYRGVEAIQKGRLEEARKYFEKQLEGHDQGWLDNRWHLFSYLNIAETYRREGNLRQAAQEYKKALQISNLNDMRDLSAFISEQLSKCFAALGDLDAESLYHKEYLDRMESIHNSRLSYVAELKYISDLKKEEENRREAQLREKNQRYLIMGVVIILVIVVFASALILRQNRRLRKHNSMLFERYQNILDKTSVKDDTKYSNIKLTNDLRKDLSERIRKVMEEADIICRQDFSLKDMAKMVDSNTTYVSRVINEDYGITFATLLSNLRVREACRRINEDRYTNITIEAIANNVGFKSRTAFLNAFKREVGLSPSEYIRMAKKEKEA